MTRVTRAHAVSHGAQVNAQNDAQTVQNLLTQAGQAPNLEEKQRILNDAYQIIRKHAPTRSATLTSEYEKLFFEVLHMYATKTCYAQEGKEKDADGNSLDEEEGFRKCARLCEFSLYLQLKSLKLARDQNHSWNLHQTLEDLIMSLGAEKTEKGKYFDLVTQLDIDPEVLIQKTEELSIREIFSQTLTRISYCYQNIDALTTVEHVHIHKALNALTAKLIGSETEKQKEALIDFLYNRALVVTRLEHPDDTDAKLKSYEPIQARIFELHSEDTVKAKSLLAQIANIQGLIIYRSKAKDALTYAEPYFQKAFAIREKLVDQFEQDADRWSQKGLLCNIRTSLIECSVARKWRTSKNITEAKTHAQALKVFLREAERRGDAHCYFSGYTPFIEKAEKAKLTWKEWFYEVFTSCRR